ncbi:MAG: LmeA family phospholipid-binding protein [Dermatophilaceae bacterium]
MNGRSFAAGLGTGLLVAVLAVLALLLWVSSPTGDAPGTATRPSSPTSAAPTAAAEGETRLADVELTSSDVVTADGPLRDVRAVGAGVILSQDGLSADRLEIVATLPFETAAAQIGDGIELFAAGELTGLRRSVEILGRTIDIEATGRVSAQDGRLVIEPETVDLGSADWIDQIASAAVRSLVTIRHTVTGIPEGMLLETVQVQPDGFRVDLTGNDVRIG